MHYQQVARVVRGGRGRLLLPKLVLGRNIERQQRLRICLSEHITDQIVRQLNTAIPRIDRKLLNEDNCYSSATERPTERA